MTTGAGGWGVGKLHVMGVVFLGDRAAVLVIRLMSVIKVQWIESAEENV